MSEWMRRWGYEMSKETVQPGLYRLKAGGYYVVARPRKRSSDGVDRRENRSEAMHGATLQEARARRDALLTDAQDHVQGKARSRRSFAEYARSLFEAKVNAGDIPSPSTQERWAGALAVVLPHLGAHACHELRAVHFVDMRDAIAKRLTADPRATMVVNSFRDGKPIKKKVKVRIVADTANGWFGILRTICRRMTAVLELDRNPCDALVDFTRVDKAYTAEQPNTLTAEEVGPFLATMRARFPQHYAMTLLHFYTGLRPSSLRPLRRVPDERGECDVDWKKGVILVRRSNSRRQVVIRKTKTGHDQEIALPITVLDALQDHVDHLPEGKMSESVYLFPSDLGGMRTRSVLDKPFATVARLMGLKKKITPGRGTRRSFNDLARNAGVDMLITKSISGHIRDEMVERYSTIAQHEKRTAIGSVIDFVKERGKRTAGTG